MRKDVSKAENLKYYIYIFYNNAFFKMEKLMIRKYLLLSK